MNGKPVLLSRDPNDGYKIENDIVGVRVWGTPTQSTLSVGRSDIWDRRWFGDRQPMITMAKLRELAAAGRLAEVAPEENSTVYDVYGRYDFPCPKPAGQVIIGAPFGRSATIDRDGTGTVRLSIEGMDKRLTCSMWVALARPLIVMQFQSDGLECEDFWLRVYRHRDTICPGQPTDLSLGGRLSSKDFEQLPSPRCFLNGETWGIRQDFPADPTFPKGFTSVLAAAAIGAKPGIECREQERGLGTPYWAEQEGRLGHMLVKRYTPINEAAGSAATAGFSRAPQELTILAAIVTSQDSPDAQAFARSTLE